MVWENKDNENQSLDELRNHFSLENIMDSGIMTSVPSSGDLEQGQFRLVYTGGTLYLYTRYGESLYRISFSAV